MEKKFFLFLALLLIGVLPSHAQKVKVKKGNVYVDDVIVYKTSRDGSMLSTAQDKYITNMSGDTLVRLIHADVQVPKTVYESGASEHDYYWVASFLGTDRKVNFKGNINYFEEGLVKGGVLKDGKIDTSAMTAYEQEMLPDMVPIEKLSKAIEHRLKLAAMPGYEEYTKKLVKRSTMKIFHAHLGKIYFESTVGAPPEQIGTFEKKEVKGGMEILVRRGSDNALVAVIKHDIVNVRMVINTEFDKATITYPINGRFDNVLIENTIRYLVEYGYL